MGCMAEEALHASTCMLVERSDWKRTMQISAVLSMCCVAEKGNVLWPCVYVCVLHRCDYDKVDARFYYDRAVEPDGSVSFRTEKMRMEATLEIEGMEAEPAAV